MRDVLPWLDASLPLPSVHGLILRCAVRPLITIRVLWSGSLERFGVGAAAFLMNCLVRVRVGQTR